jgi:type II secretory pathway component PulF
MQDKKSPFHPKALLWWVAIVALGISGALFYFLKESAQYDAALEQRRMIFPVIGIIIAGTCFIAGTAGRWFYPK